VANDLVAREPADHDLVAHDLLAHDKDFRQRVQKIGDLVRELECIADPAVRAAAKGLLQSLMDLHGAGLERTLEIIFNSGAAGAQLVDELGRDPLVSSLLVLYGLHPLDIEVRVREKLEQIRTRLFKVGAQASLISVNGNDIHVRIQIESHACGSTARTVQAVVEDALYEAAPDLTSLTIEGLEQPSPSGFVAVTQLVSTSVSLPHHGSPHDLPTLESTANAEGMD
jgi:Fe-S cluster biogenesis protein NfuA